MSHYLLIHILRLALIMIIVAINCVAREVHEAITNGQFFKLHDVALLVNILTLLWLKRRRMDLFVVKCIKLNLLQTRISLTKSVFILI